MGSYFRQSRNVELSVLEYMETNYAADWTGITVVKTFKDAYDTGIPVPVVCIRLASTDNARLEIGADTLDNRYVIILDIFAKSNAQRLDIADYTVNKLKDGWVYNLYAHASGDKSTIIGTADGRLYVTNWGTNSKIDMGEGADPKDRFRHTLSVSVRKSS